MYPPGHFALAYFFVQVLNIFVKEDYKIWLIWFVSILPDMDILFIPYISHRGATHSIIVMIGVFIPLLLYYKRGSAYFVALLSHLIGDYVTYSGIKLLWPLSNRNYMVPLEYLIQDRDVWKIEAILFALMIIHMIYFKPREK